jgi:hypothetical protein
MPQLTQEDLTARSGEAAMTPLFDVVAVDLTTNAERVMERGLTHKNAEAYVMMAVMRRGVEDEFFKTVPQDAPPGTQADNEVRNQMKRTCLKEHHDQTEHQET